jgi:peptide methionine sulfoxide reductase msrA/msrB
MKKLCFIFFVFLLGGLGLLLWTPQMPEQVEIRPTAERLVDVPDSAELATFAGGCFWCIENAFENQAGVYESVSGYAGGTEKTATYYEVSGGNTLHREAVQIHYDPEQVSYEELLEIFWRQIDPTDEGGQFADRGFHYSTAIFTHDEEQAEMALESKLALEESDRFEDPIVTEIVTYTTFFLAEEEHQDFALKQQDYYKNYATGSGRVGFIEEEWE